MLGVSQIELKKYEKEQNHLRHLFQFQKAMQMILPIIGL